MKSNDIVNLLIQLIENLKPFRAKWDTTCTSCGDSIWEGDTFYFVGDKDKVCTTCIRELIRGLNRMDIKHED